MLHLFFFFVEKCENAVIDANAPGVVINSLPKNSLSENLLILNGTELRCWSSDFTESYLKVDFGAYSVICALQFSFNGSIEISYGNKSLNNSKVCTHVALQMMQCVDLYIIIYILYSATIYP